MGDILLQHLKDYVGRQVSVRGYVRNIREFSEFRFLFLRDRSGIGQTIIPNSVYSEPIYLEDIVRLQGTVVSRPQSKYDGLELYASDVAFLSRGVPVSCFNLKQEKTLGLDLLLEKRAASLRLDTPRETFMLQSDLIHAFSTYLHTHGFVEVKTPKIIATCLEGGANLFSVDYFGSEAFLSQSPQLYHQMALVSFERVFEIGPCYRAEPYATTRHVNEFTSIDAEIGFVCDHREVMDFIQSMITHVFTDTLCRDAPEFSSAGYYDALAHSKASDERRLTAEQKREIGAFYKKEHNADFVFIDGYPEDLSFFYSVPYREELTQSFRLLYHGQEICSGAQRIHDYAQLVTSMKQKGLNLDTFSHYLGAFQCGIPPHGGFCIGLNRLTSLLSNLGNIREAVLFPRDPHRLAP